MNEKQTLISLSDDVKIEIIHAIKDVLIRLIDAVYPQTKEQ